MKHPKDKKPTQASHSLVEQVLDHFYELLAEESELTVAVRTRLELLRTQDKLGDSSAILAAVRQVHETS